MATRPRNGSSRTQSPNPPPVLNEEVGATSSRSAAESPPDATIERANLERREIPSFSESREARIAEAAYWRAERRGFVAGQELDDWLAAEREIDDQDEREGRRAHAPSGESASARDRPAQG